MEIGRSIAKIRKENALTQETFAEKYNVTQQTISNWENGRSYPDLDTIVQISEDFDVSLDVLMKGDKEMIRDFSKRLKLEKYYRIIVITIVGLLVIALGIQAYRGISYLRTKDRLESRFYNGVEKHGFIRDESGEDTIYYLEASDGVRYEAPDAEMKDFYTGSAYWDLYYKYINAYRDSDNTVSIENNDGSKTKIPYHLKLVYSEHFCDIYAIQDGDDAPVDTGLIIINEDGYEYNMSKLMYQIYEDNKDQIDDAIKTMTEMWDDMYYPDK